MFKIKGVSQKGMKRNGMKKVNYKKKIKCFSECNICYDSVEDCSDNTILCGKIKHTICGNCKIKMGAEDCPMCRSHKIKMPISQDINIKIIKKNKKSKSKTIGYIINPKLRRNYRRNNPYYEPFGHNTNRLVRQRNNRFNRFNRYHEETTTNTIWLTQEQVLEYNGALRTEYDTASDSSEDTLSLTDRDSVSEGTITRILFMDDEF